MNAENCADPYYVHITFSKNPALKSPLASTDHQEEAFSIRSGSKSALISRLHRNDGAEEFLHNLSADNMRPHVA